MTITLNDGQDLTITLQRSLDSPNLSWVTVKIDKYMEEEFTVITRNLHEALEIIEDQYEMHSDWPWKTS